MNRTQRVSGAEFKKKRKQRLEIDEKLQICFKKWLVTKFSVEKQIISEDVCNEVSNICLIVIQQMFETEVFQTTLVNDLS